MDSGGSFTNDRWDRSPEDCAGLYEKKKVKLSSRLTRLKELVKLTVSYYKGGTLSYSCSLGEAVY